MADLTPDVTRALLTAATALHLLNRRPAKRQVCFVEVAASALLPGRPGRFPLGFR